MTKPISRRAFLKGGIAAAGAVAVSSLPVPQTVKGATGTELATLIDIRKCIGCEACVEACKEMNTPKFPEPKKPFPKMYPNRVKVFDWSEDRDVSDRLTPYNWLFIQEAVVNVNGEEKILTIPRRCMH
ncbi:MAG: 4Fe-4S dicluster domain-containing protein, partial [Deltaproteobacteria bacterium]